MAHRRPWSGLGDGAAREVHVKCTWGELVEWLGEPLSEPSPKLKLRKTFDVRLGKSGWWARSVMCTCAACTGGWIRPGDPHAGPTAGRHRSAAWSTRTVSVGTWNASFSSADMRRLLRARRRLLVAKTKAG